MGGQKIFAYYSGITDPLLVLRLPYFHDFCLSVTHFLSKKTVFFAILAATPVQAESWMMPDTRTDEELMMAYCEGDANAFQLLYERYRVPLYRFVLRQIGQTATSEELFQDIWINIIRSRTRYEVEARFRTFLYQIARNRIVDHYRRNAIRITAHDGSHSAHLEAKTFDNSAETQTENEQIRTKIIDAVVHLSREQRDVFLLKEEAGLSIAEIADVTGVNHDTAKSRYRYAIKRLRQLLGDEVIAYHE